jgi:hypothetical protein
MSASFHDDREAVEAVYASRKVRPSLHWLARLRDCQVLLNLCRGTEATFPARLKWNHFFMVAKKRQIIYRLRPQIKRLKLIAFSCCRVLRRAG